MARECAGYRPSSSRGALSVDGAIDHDRAGAIGRALGAIPEAVYDALERQSPAWPVLTQLCTLTHPYGLLTGLAVSLSNYQLGRGGGAQYWEDARRELDRHGPIASTTDLKGFMQDLMRRPSAFRMARQKLARVDKLISSSLPSWLKERTWSDLGQDSSETWSALANAMGQARDKKTIAYALRTFDRMHKIATNCYVDFPLPVPIAVDLRIGRVSLSSGLMRVSSPSEVVHLMETGDKYVKTETKKLLRAWAVVSENSGRVSLFRIDGLVWQVAEPIYRERHQQRAAVESTATALIAWGVDVSTATTVSQELADALPN